MSTSSDPKQNYRTCTGNPNTLGLPGQMGDLLINTAGELYTYDGAAPWQQLSPAVPIGEGDTPVSPVAPMLFGSEDPNSGPTAGTAGQVFVRVDGNSSAVYQHNGTTWGVIGRARNRGRGPVFASLDMGGEVSRFVYLGDDCTVEMLAVIAEDAVTVAPAVFTLEINGTPVTGGSLSIAVGPAGSNGSNATTAANALISGDVVTVTSSGGSGAGRARASLECKW